MTHYAFKFGYEGQYFTGFQRGNGEHSIEDAIIYVLRENDFEYDIRTAARTDRYVSAVSNVFTLETARDPDSVANLINSKEKHIFVHSYAIVADSFNPRHCTYKIYRYYIFDDIDCLAMENVIRKFIGTHDFRSFARVDSRRTMRTILDAKCVEEDNRQYLEFKARSFLWNQVRTMVAFAQDNAETGIDPFSIEGRYPRVARPNNLILWEIYYEGLEFKGVRRMPKKMHELYEDSNIDAMLLENLIRKFDHGI
ncbi:tRNA pseudouridine(38-40) synthase TruA [Thermoplasma sp. Kam2015]|uniref:tRNA pseudouridine(38-40) synthase TruA n=1 Tax=Thermoplasma sp. Kam2015 TaxID=2094122 RepID=UPI000D8BBAD6|nr:tRNA pseudouridine(38-40) synthase TruA [Thermoplasma sp. Kam2015]PYB67994.1 tRNA pseudouridine(38-40) synthase TruA [Thermoplasma sp. Kam2015]